MEYTHTQRKEVQSRMDPTELIQALGMGHLLGDVSLKLSNVAQAVVETRNPGSVVITLKVAPVEGSDTAVTVIENVDGKFPKLNPHGAVLFTAMDGMLHRSDPRQVSFDVQTVESGAPELRIIEQRAARVSEAN